MAMSTQNGNIFRSDDEEDQLCGALHSRLVKTGEWHKLSHSFEQLLQDSTWAAQASKNAASMAKSMAEPEADDIARAVVDDGKRSIPSSVESQILKQIREFLDRNLEDA